MKLLEYEAKSILKAGGIATPKSYIVGEHSEFLPAVIKSQVPIGGRGKAGGIKIVESEEEYRAAADDLVKLEIKGFRPQKLLAEEVLDIKRELYLSLLIDKAQPSVVLMANTNGGVDVEENTDDSYLKVAISETSDFIQVGEQLAKYFDLPDKTFILQDLIGRLYHLFVRQDMTLCEINPLVLTRVGELVAGDAKVALDDANAAHTRHPDWDFEAGKLEANFVTLDHDSNVATIANGAGLAMATVDAVADAGMTPANFLDIGGGASEASVLSAFQRIMEYPNIKVIIINIFAGITRCDEVARAIIAAKSHIQNLPPLDIRLAGTNYEQAAELLAQHDITIHQTLHDAISSAKEAL